MATNRKSTSKKPQPRPRKTAASVAKKTQTHAELRQQLARLANELEECQLQLTEALQRENATASENARLVEQQTATSEILGVIASSPTDIQPVLDTVVRNAARVCGATDADIAMSNGSASLRIVASYGSAQGSPVGTERPLNRDTVLGRAIVDAETVHIDDFLEVAADYSQSNASQRGYRTMLATPLRR